MTALLAYVSDAAPTAPSAGTARVRAKLLAGGCLALLMVSFAGAVQADELKPVQGRTIVLGPVSGTAYYTNGATGSRLVMTLSRDGGDTPARVVATLAAGQSVTLSVPRGVGEPAVEVTFHRVGDRVFVNDAATTVQVTE